MPASATATLRDISNTQTAPKGTVADTNQKPLGLLRQPRGHQVQPVAPEKLVAVPVRQRSNRPGSAVALAASQAAAAPDFQNFRQVALPATPPPASNGPDVTPAMEGAGPAAGELPATTPLAAEVLTGLASAAAAPGTETPGGGPAAPGQLSNSSVAGGILRSDSDGASMDVLAAAAAATPAAAEHEVATAVAAATELRLHSSVAAMAAAAATAAAAAFVGNGPVSRPRAASLAQQQEAGRKGCNCKRSMCLKMYCECFAAGGYCAPGCACSNCSNHQGQTAAVQQARQVVLAKDAKAFEKKVTAADGHKRGCRCKRSKCLKKYCECYNAGAKCNPDVCQCEGCKNSDGDGQGMPAAIARTDSTDVAMAVAPWQQDQQPVMLPALQMLTGLLATQQQHLEGPQLSAGDKADSSGHSQAAVPLAGQEQQHRQARPGLLAARATTTASVLGQQQGRGQAAALPTGIAAPQLAFAAFTLADFQQQAGEGRILHAPLFVGPTGALMPGLFPGMAPFLFPQPMAGAAAAAAAATLAAGGPQQLPPFLLPIAPLHTAAAAEPTGLAVSPPEAGASSHGDATSLLAAAASGAATAMPATMAAPAEGSLQRLPLFAAGPPAAQVGGAVGAAGSGAGAQSELVAVEGRPGAVALTAHLSEVLGTLDPDIRDTATSPAPHTAVSRLPGIAKGAPAATLTARRPPPGGGLRAIIEQGSKGSAWGSEKSASACTVTSTAGADDSAQRGRRPKRAASSGVVGAVAAEAAAWGDEWTSPPKRASSVPLAGSSGQNRSKGPGRFALLRKALEAETLQAQKRARGCLATALGCGPAKMVAEEEDAISALFELSSSRALTDKAQVLDDVRGVVAEQIGTELDKVLPESTFATLGADSLDTVEILMALEEKFDIQLDEEGAEKVTTVQDAAELICTQIK
ncbi:hypothetical protein N2152v2_007758 [Parachlorella kessleri]